MNTAENEKLSTEKSLDAMWQFSQTYAKRTGTYFALNLQ
jgi:ferredoxin-thioredoxin reductase catalytic chain